MVKSKKVRICERGLNHPARVIRKSDQSIRGFRILMPLLWTVLLFPAELFAVNVDLIAVDSFLKEAPTIEKVFPYVINLASDSRPRHQSAIKQYENLTNSLIYYIKVKVDGVIYYRLSLGNFSTRRQAQITLDKVKTHFPSAWIGRRIKRERQLLSAAINQLKKDLPVEIKSQPVEIKSQPMEEKIAIPKKKPSPSRTPETSLANKLSKQAKEEFLNQNYLSVIRITDKLMEIGDTNQRQQAMEFVGLARERQRKFAQAIAIYEEFLNLFPESKLGPRIKQRLQGLKTMDLDPKQSIVSQPVAEEEAVDWVLRGALSQYYRQDLLDRGEIENEPVNETLVTDVDIYARRNTETTSTVIRFDGGVVNDRIDDETDSSIIRALVNYTDNESGYQITGGRQTQTAKGIFSRFDGFVYQGLSHADFDYSLHTGYIVDSSYESADSDRQFYGASITFSPFESVEMDVYVLHQEIFDLTDRQAIGTEFHIRGDQGFLYGIVDYDAFYENLNNVTAITNYRFDDRWTLNLTYDYRNSPLLTTTNAIQGQGVESIDELQELFTNREIYELAEDRTAISQNVFAGVSYQLNVDRQLYFSLSFTGIDSTEASGGVPEIPATDDIHIYSEYSIRGYFFEDDYSSIGLRLSDTSSAETISLRTRTRFPGPGGIRYDPRIRVDFRKSQNLDVEQWILAPSIKLTYQYGRNISFEGSFGIEYSNFDLPELDDQTIYNFFLGYVYQF